MANEKKDEIDITYVIRIISNIVDIVNFFIALFVFVRFFIKLRDSKFEKVHLFVISVYALIFSTTFLWSLADIYFNLYE